MLQYKNGCMVPTASVNAKKKRPDLFEYAKSLIFPGSTEEKTDQEQGTGGTYNRTIILN